MKKIGVDIGGTKIRAGLIKNKKIIKESYYKIPKNSSERNVINLITKSIDEVYSKDINSIGIAIPSIIDKNGIVYEVNNIKSFKKIAIKDILFKKYKVRINVINDAEAFVIGEYKFLKRYKNIVGLIIGTGLGAGIIINKKSYKGLNNGAGEFGKIPYLNSTIEDYSSSKFFLKHNIKGEELYKKAINKDKNAIKIFKDYAEHLAVCIGIIVNTFDPELIVIGGSVSKSNKFFHSEMIKHLKKQVFKESYKNIKIKYSKNSNSALFGAIN